MAERLEHLLTAQSTPRPLSATETAHRAVPLAPTRPSGGECREKVFSFDDFACALRLLEKGTPRTISLPPAQVGSVRYQFTPEEAVEEVSVARCGPGEGRGVRFHAPFSNYHAGRCGVHCIPPANSAA